jgi:heme/copper-type cytochrome/quinol oxidase subunit 4
VSDLKTRIAAMHRRDVQVAWAFVVGLWLSIIFVAVATWSLAPSGTARTVLLAGGAIILILNTAAIMAMLRHYREDRDFMYGLDIKFLDAARARKGGM